MEHKTDDQDKFLRFDMTEEEFRELTDNYQGLCVSCGETRDSCEPDARKHLCENCNQRLAYGAEELLLMGRINFTEE